MNTYSKYQVETAIIVALQIRQLVPPSVSNEDLLSTFPWDTLAQGADGGEFAEDQA